MDLGELIPIVLFLTIGGVLALVYYFRYRTRKEIQTTVRSAIEKGQQLSPELIEGLMESLNPPHADLRRGIISIAIGIAVLLMGSLIGEEDAVGPLMAVSMFPLLVGVAYLLLWFYTSRSRQVRDRGATMAGPGGG